MPAGRWTKLRRRQRLCGRPVHLLAGTDGEFSGDHRDELVLGMAVGRHREAVGELEAEHEGPLLGRVASRTAAWAPLGSDAGAGPQLTASPGTTVWCASSAKAVPATWLHPIDNNRHAVAMDSFCMRRAPSTARQPPTRCERLREAKARTWIRAWEAAWKWPWKSGRADRRPAGPIGAKPGGSAAAGSGCAFALGVRGLEAA